MRLPPATRPQLATRTSSPLLVSRGRPNPAGPVLVCGDLVLPNNPAISVAFEEAALGGCGLQAVHIPRRPLTPVSKHWRQRKAPAATHGAEAGEHPAPAQLTAWHDLLAVLMQPPQPARRQPLIDATHNTRLVVITSPPYHKTPVTLLCSVSKDLLHHSHCPVLVVAHSDGTGAES